MNRMWLSNFHIPEYQLAFLLVGIGLHLWSGSAITFGTNAITLGIGVVGISRSNFQQLHLTELDILR